jgi:hypothetical protein
VSARPALLVFNCEQRLQGRTWGLKSAAANARSNSNRAVPLRAMALRIQAKGAQLKRAATNSTANSQTQEIGAPRRMPLCRAPLADVQLVGHAGLHRLHPADDVLQHRFEGLRFAHVVVFLALEKLLEK